MQRICFHNPGLRASGGATAVRDPTRGKQLSVADPAVRPIPLTRSIGEHRLLGSSYHCPAYLLF